MTFLDELRAEAAEVTKNATLELPVPASQFIVRFKPPDREKLTGIVAVYRVGGALSSDQERQLIVDCCDEIMRRNEKTDELEPADPEGGKLTFDGGDERWGKDVKTAREAVAKLYKLDQRPLAAAGVADALIDWLQGLNDEAVRRAEGKSGSTAESSETPPAST